MALASVLLLVGCSAKTEETLVTKPVLSEKIITIQPMQISSPAFANSQPIPAKYTCDGKDINPPLQISDVPAGTMSLALVSDDPDAPMGTWVHWLLWNISPAVTAIPENDVPAGVSQGTTSWQKPGYGGPCPPSGTHRYFFKLYALDAILNLSATAGKKDLESAMKGHILAQAELVGLYSRQND